MPSSRRQRTARVQRTMCSMPEKAWSLLADITRMGEWSPETTVAVWRKGATGPWVLASKARTKGARRSGPPTAP